MGSVNERTELQVCYRTQRETEVDEQYTFHHHWATGLETAKVVLDTVQWYTASLNRS